MNTNRAIHERVRRHLFPAIMVLCIATIACGSSIPKTPPTTTELPTLITTPTTTLAPTASFTPTPTLPAITPTVTVTPVCAQCRITVISAKNEGTRIYDPAFGQGGYVTVKYPNTHFLGVRVQIEGLGDADVQGIGWLRILMIGGKKVRDRDGNTYACTYSTSPAPIPDRSRDITYYFEVPDNIVVTDLIWLDRPPIPLNVK